MAEREKLHNKKTAILTENPVRTEFKTLTKNSGSKKILTWKISLHYVLWEVLRELKQ